MAWACKSCTWLNTNSDHLACSMCNTERIENEAGEPSTSQLVSGIDIPVSSIEDNTQPCDINNNDNTDQLISTGVDDNNESLQQFDNRKQPHAPTQEDQNDIKQIQDGTSKDGGGKKKKWDAFASLQSNYESSDDDDDSANDGSINKDEGSNRRNGQRNNSNNAGWNAFASLEQNYESSDESESGSSSDGSDEGEESDGFCIEDDGHYGDLVDSEDEMKKESSLKINSIVECVDLLDSEDDEQNDQREEDDYSVCELDVKMPAGKDIPGKENNKSDKKRRSRLRKRSLPKHPEAYTIDIGDSDSELSEVESRPLPSPELARQQRQMPSWQRRRRSTPIQASNGNLKKASDYACMNDRNDLSGGSGTGVNGVRLAKKKGDDTTTTTTSIKRKSGGRRKRRATSLPGLSMTTETTTSKPTTKRRRKATASKTTSSKAKAPKAKRRRKRSYKKRSTKRRGGNTGGNNAWAARERGVRGGQRRGNAGSAAPYMAIAKQEPLLANIGGASIQF